MNGEKSMWLKILAWIVMGLTYNIRPNLRAVSYYWVDKTILVNAFFDGEIDVNDRELMDDTETGIYIHLDDDWIVEFNCIRLDAPTKVRLEKGHGLVYHRFEENPDCPILS